MQSAPQPLAGLICTVYFGLKTKYESSYEYWNIGNIVSLEILKETIGNVGNAGIDVKLKKYFK